MPLNVGDSVPSLEISGKVKVQMAEGPENATAVGIPVRPGGDLPPSSDLDWSDLEIAGFSGAPGESFAVVRPGAPTLVLTGVGEGEVGASRFREAGAALARTATRHSRLAFDLSGWEGSLPTQAVVEGVLLARYRYDVLKKEPSVTAVESLTFFGGDPQHVEEGIRVGKVMAEAQMVARDLANDPPAVLTAARLADVASNLGQQRGLDVEVFDERALLEMGCGGLLGVNAGSAEPARMIKLTYRPPGAAGHHLTLVGKGITYDAGGISLKPADEVHATMKNDMSGAGAILAAMLALGDLGCPNTVVGYLMCTDNRPSGTALAMGDVIRIRGGKTVEVANTDAEGRLVMADGIALASEKQPDAIVDIATLTGACVVALGNRTMGVMANDDELRERVTGAANGAGESAWGMPLPEEIRGTMDSPVADLKHTGDRAGGMMVAAKFLEEFVGKDAAGESIKWSHIDIAGPAFNEKSAWGYTPTGGTGSGVRALIEVARSYA